MASPRPDEGDTSLSLTLIPQGLPETKLRFF